jgi:FkbM family methyltransferase
MPFSKQDLKFLLRSRSLAFMRAARFGATGPIEQCDWRGHTLHYRPGTSDPHLIYKILLREGRKGEYVFPPGLRAKVIFDIGANIGAASVLLAERFPGARIYAFEPMAENFELLKQNTVKAPNVTPVQLALASGTGERELIHSPDRFNRGGYSFFQHGAPAETPRTAVPTATAARFMREQGIDSVDLIKVDTEGAEYEILTGFDPAALQQVKWIIGELHGERDFELLAYLSQWFDISMKRSMRKPLFIFNACNRNVLAEVLA